MIRHNGINYPKVRYGGHTYTKARYGGVTFDLAPESPPMQTFFETLVQRADVLTAAEFLTTTAVNSTRYRQVGSTNIGQLIAEFRRAGIPVNVPLIRGLRSNNATHIELRNYGGDLTARGGIVNPNAGGWSRWPPIDSAAHDDAIYLIDATAQEWLAINPNGRSNRSGGGTWANWNGVIGTAYAHSFANTAAGESYIAAMRTATTERRIFAAVLDNHDYIPTF